MSMLLLVRVPWSTRVWALPFVTVLALGTQPAGLAPRRHKTSIDWVVHLITAVRRWQPERAMVLVVDGALAAVKLGLRCQQAAVPVTLVSRLRPDACLFDPTPRPRTSRRGFAPTIGARLPKLDQRAADASTVWAATSVAWYGGTARTVDLATGVAVWRVPKQAPLPLRWVIVRDPLGRFAPQYLFATDVTVAAAQIVAWYVLRWSVEVSQAHCPHTPRGDHDRAALLALLPLIYTIVRSFGRSCPPKCYPTWSVQVTSLR